MPLHRGWGKSAENNCPHPDRKRDLLRSAHPRNELRRRLKRWVHVKAPEGEAQKRRRTLQICDFSRSPLQRCRRLQPFGFRF